MRLKISLLSIFFLSLITVFGFLSPKIALADTVTLSGIVQDSGGNAIGNATVSVNDANSDHTTTDPTTGNYSLNIPAGTYNVTVTPPSGSNFSSAVALSQNITTSTTLNFILTPSGSVTLRGHVYDAAGVPISGQKVSLTPSVGANISTTTDFSGYYSLTVSPATYNFLTFSNPSGVSTQAFPSNYQLQSGNFAITQDISLDLTIPAINVPVQIQDATNTPVSGITVDALTQNAIPVTISSINFTASNIESISSPTNNNGTTSVWLIPTIGTSATYTFTATPPSGSNYLTTLKQNVSITDSTPVTMTLKPAVKVTGHVYDAAGVPVSGQKVSLTPPVGANISTTTNDFGEYSLTVSPDTYSFFTFSDPSGVSTQAFPSNYQLQTTNFSVTHDTVFDLTIPAISVPVYVQNTTDTPVSGVTVDASAQNVIPLVINGMNFNAVSSESISSQTDTNGNTSVWLIPTTGSNTTYTFTATPPSGSNYLTTLVSNLIVVDSTPVNITLNQPVKLTGHVFDAAGVPISGQKVSLTPSVGANISTTTGYDGSYSLTVSPATYNFLTFSNPSGVSTQAFPSLYKLQTASFVLTHDTTLDINIPAVQVNTHIQDATNTPVSGVTIDATANNVIPVNIDNLNFNAVNTESLSSQTDTNGNTSVWLIPTTGSNTTYAFTAKPPVGSVYNTFLLNNVHITSDPVQNEVISLQYNHATPVTTAALSPNPVGQGQYSNPVTVTLSATPASGYTVANIYYTVDGKTKQTYLAPFTVSGLGNHTITYWSVDNSGVQEIPNTKSFTIVQTFNLSGTVFVDTNNNGVQDSGETGYSGLTVTLNSGQTTTTDSNGSYNFLSLPQNTYTETLSVPTGYSTTTTNPISSPLTSDTTVNFGIALLPNVAPVISAITAPTTPVQVSTSMTASASFSDGNVNDSHTATWNWGDGNTTTGTVTESNGSGNVSNTHTYSAAGIYTVTLAVTDNHGASTTSAPFNYVVVFDPSAGWVAGSKEFTSPAGAVTGNSSVSGTATFGFQVKYANGAMVPSGKNVSFSFPAGNINFASTSYQWLVVNNPKAVFYANGTLNGVSGYTILISSLDQSSSHQNGAIRIQIRDVNQDVVYDTQPGDSGTADPLTAVTKGQIAVH